MSEHATLSAKVSEPAASVIPVCLPIPVYEDPLDEDSADDPIIATTRRALVRLALTAAETAGRFQREEKGIDPMAWMLAPRRMFHGSTALEACLQRSACVRALLLHGLGTGLDADPAELDALAADDGRDDDDVEAAHPFNLVGGTRVAPSTDGEGSRLSRAALYSSTVVCEMAEGLIHIFDALVADGREEARSALCERHGPLLAGRAVLVRGFDPHLPLVQALVSPALADMLVQVDRAPTSPLARGLSISIEQRFAA